jgi:DNA-binding transcriptional MocR family regulator
MTDLGVAPGTVTRALAELAREGLVVTEPGSGTFVAEPEGTKSRSEDLSWQSARLSPLDARAEELDDLRVVPHPQVLDLTSSYLDESLQPSRLLASAMSRAARRPGAWGRIAPEGLEPLRVFFAQELVRGGEHDVTITTGGQAALSTCFRALARPGDPVIFESPTYVGALVAARAAGLVPIPAPSDGDGLRTDGLASLVRSTGARALYVQPRHASPTASVLAVDRRRELMALAESHGLFIIEDDWMRDLDLDAQPSPPPLASDDPGGHVMYVRSLTKPVAPGLRIAGVAAKGPVARRVRRLRAVEELFVPGVLQEAALEVMTSPAWRRHLQQVRSELRSRRDALATALAAAAPHATITRMPTGGLVMWIALARTTDDRAIAAELKDHGVTAIPGATWFPTEPTGSFLRLSYAAEPPERLIEAAGRLAQVLRDTRGAPRAET